MDLTKLNKLYLDGAEVPIGISEEVQAALDRKQNIYDELLNTDNKTIPNAINEILEKSNNANNEAQNALLQALDAFMIAKGANKAKSFPHYAQMINDFSGIEDGTQNSLYPHPDYDNLNALNVGQNIMIETINVPDLWISGINSSDDYDRTIYTLYMDGSITDLDAYIKEQLSINGSFKVGYYTFSQLETQISGSSGTSAILVNIPEIGNFLKNNPTLSVGTILIPEDPTYPSLVIKNVRPPDDSTMYDFPGEEIFLQNLKASVLSKSTIEIHHYSLGTLDPSFALMEDYVDRKITSVLDELLNTEM